MSNEEKMRREQNGPDEDTLEEIDRETAREDCNEAAHQTGSSKGGQSPESGEPKTQSEDAEAKDEDVQSQESANDSEDEELNLKYMRLMADFQNFKRRTEKEKNDIYAFANEKIVSELLNVIDNFERALSAAAQKDSFSEGMELILKQLQGVLEKAGVVEIEALGVDFDPNFHNAVMMEDSAQYESGKVTCVLQRGYLLNNRVIRPSMVKVAN